MKKFVFNVQSKGGAGKSMLTWLMALKYEKDPTVFFVDFDSSTKTSTHQLKFLSVLSPTRLASVEILDGRNRLDREQIFGILEELSAQPEEVFILDFGAPESQQLPSLFTIDFTVDDFKDFEGSLDSQFVFNIIIAGGAVH